MLINKLNFGIMLVWCLVAILTPSENAKLWAQEKVEVSFQPDKDKGQPKGGTASGGTRPVNNSCISDSQKNKDTLTALSPGGHLGLTMFEHPKLLVYLPSTKAQNAELSIFDAQMQGVYQVNLSVANHRGFVNLPLFNGADTTVSNINSKTLPDELKTPIALEKNKSYHWTLALICNESDRTEDIVVGGWIEYVKPSEDLQRQLNLVSGIKKVSLLAKNGYWYDAVSQLLKMRQKKPDSLILAQTWEQLFKSVGLEEISKKSINELQLVTTRKY